jgi:hypothetical protein
MKACKHLLREYDNAGATGFFVCVHCGEKIMGGMEMYDKYRIIKPPRPKVPADKLTVIFAYVMGGILVLASIAATIGVIWEKYFNR